MQFQKRVVSRIICLILKHQQKPNKRTVGFSSFINPKTCDQWASASKRPAIYILEPIDASQTMCFSEREKKLRFCSGAKFQKPTIIRRAMIIRLLLAQTNLYGFSKRQQALTKCEVICVLIAPASAVVAEMEYNTSLASAPNVTSHIARPRNMPCLPLEFSTSIEFAYHAFLLCIRSTPFISCRGGAVDFHIPIDNSDGLAR